MKNTKPVPLSCRQDASTWQRQLWRVRVGGTSVSLCRNRACERLVACLTTKSRAIASARVPAVLPKKAAVVTFRVDRGHSVLPVRNLLTVHVPAHVRILRRHLPKRKVITARSRGPCARMTIVRRAPSVPGHRGLHRIALRETVHERPAASDRLPLVLLPGHPLAALSPLAPHQVVRLLLALQQRVRVRKAPPHLFVSAAQKVRVLTPARSRALHAKRTKYLNDPGHHGFV